MSNTPDQPYRPCKEHPNCLVRSDGSHSGPMESIGVVGEPPKDQPIDLGPTMNRMNKLAVDQPSLREAPLFAADHFDSDKILAELLKTPDHEPIVLTGKDLRHLLTEAKIEAVKTFIESVSGDPVNIEAGEFEWIDMGAFEVEKAYQNFIATLKEEPK